MGAGGRRHAPGRTDEYRIPVTAHAHPACGCGAVTGAVAGPGLGGSVGDRAGADQVRGAAVTPEARLGDRAFADSGGAWRRLPLCEFARSGPVSGRALVAGWGTPPAPAGR